MNDLISRQAAIEALCNLARDYFSVFDERYSIFIDTLCKADKAIRALPSARPDAKDIKVLYKSVKLTPEELGLLNDGVCNLIPEQKHGRWILKDKSALDREPKHGEEMFCDQCGEIALGYPFWECDLKPSNFCPNCGAIMDMKGEQNE